MSPVGSFVGTVTLSATGAPTNANVSFNPPSVTIGPGTAISTVTLSSTAAVLPSLYAISLTGASGSLTHSVASPWTITSGGIPVALLTDSFTAATLDPGIWTTSASERRTVCEEEHCSRRCQAAADEKRERAEWAEAQKRRVEEEASSVGAETGATA